MTGGEKEIFTTALYVIFSLPLGERIKTSDKKGARQPL